MCSYVPMRPYVFLCSYVFLYVSKAIVFLWGRSRQRRQCMRCTAAPHTVPVLRTHGQGEVKIEKF